MSLTWVFWLFILWISKSGKFLLKLKGHHLGKFVLREDNLLYGSREYMASHVWENIFFNTSHVAIYWYEAISTINPFKQTKHALELKLSNFKN